MPSDLDADLHLLNQLTRGKPNGAGPGGCFGRRLGGPGLWLATAPHEAEKLTMGFDDRNKWLKYQNWRRMTSLASERYLFRWLSTTVIFDTLFFVSRIFVGWVVCTSSNFTG